MKVRLAEIAARAGVSISTVSRVLNEQPGVAPAKRRQVLTAIDVLGYDRPARLSPRAAGLIGLIVPELENPFFPTFAAHIEAGLARDGYTPVLCSQSLGGQHEDNYVQTLMEHGVSGIVFVSGIHAIAETETLRYERLVSYGLPIAFVNGYQPAVAAASFSTDDQVGISLAVSHLANMGHTQIGLAMGPLRYTPVIRKARAHVTALAREVPEMDQQRAQALQEFTTFTVEGGTEAAGALIDRGATALICGSDVMALGAMRAARLRGMSIPTDVSIVGSDDSMMNDFTDPPLTTVRQPTHALAAAVCRSMVSQIAGTPAGRSDVLFQPELVVRASTGRAPTLTTRQ